MPPFWTVSFPWLEQVTFRAAPARVQISVCLRHADSHKPLSIAMETICYSLLCHLFVGPVAAVVQGGGLQMRHADETPRDLSSTGPRDLG